MRLPDSLFTKQPAGDVILPTDNSTANTTVEKPKLPSTTILLTNEEIEAIALGINPKARDLLLTKLQGNSVTLTAQEIEMLQATYGIDFTDFSENEKNAKVFPSFTAIGLTDKKISDTKLPEVQAVEPSLINMPIDTKLPEHKTSFTTNIADNILNGIRAIMPEAIISNITGLPESSVARVIGVSTTAARFGLGFFTKDKIPTSLPSMERGAKHALVANEDKPIDPKLLDSLNSPAGTILDVLNNPVDSITKIGSNLVKDWLSGGEKAENSFWKTTEKLNEEAGLYTDAFQRLAEYNYESKVSLPSPENRDSNKIVFIVRQDFWDLSTEENLPKNRSINDISSPFIVFDLLTEEGEDNTLEVTTHPVYNDVAVSDHVFQNNEKGSCTALITKGGYYGNVNPYDVYLKLKELQQTRVPLFIRTHYNDYNNCIITTISFNKDKSTGDAVYVDISFQKIKIAILHTLTSKVQVGITTTEASKVAAQTVENMGLLQGKAGMATQGLNLVGGR